MRRVIVTLLLLCSAAARPAPAETVAGLIAQLQALSPDLKVVTRLDANVMRSIESLQVERATRLNLVVAKRPAYYEASPGGAEVAVLSASAALAAPASLAESGCDVNVLTLTDVSCAPPHGSGPDGRAWLHLTCGADKTPTPYDWQLARLDGHLADIFVWNGDPTYAYIEGASGSYQAAAVTALGTLTHSLTLQPSCAAVKSSR